MPVPNNTSAEAYDYYVEGKRIVTSRGPAWDGIRLSVVVLPRVAEVTKVPVVTEPMIVWTSSGRAEARERVPNGPWITSQLKKGSMFLTCGGEPYEFGWKTLSPEPLEVTIVVLKLTLFHAALEEVFGKNAARARLRDLSGFEDPRLTALLQQLRDEANERKPSRLSVRGLSQTMAVYLARNYTVLGEGSERENSALPGFKLRRVTDWMTEHMAERFSLVRVAKQAGMSEFHFIRLFKRATGLPPSRYLIKLRMDTARRLLRETRMSVISVANELGYENPSHFAKLFRKDTGLTPTDYRRER